MSKTGIGELVGGQLRWLRQEAGLSQAEIARRMRTHRPIVGRIERGLHDMKLEAIWDYAAALGVDPLLDVLCILDVFDEGRET